MKRTIDMMTAARAKGVELPGEWFHQRCNECFGRFGANPCTHPDKVYIGPDLTIPENLHAAFRFADALDHGSVDVTKAGDGFVCWLYPDINTEYSGTAPERHLALVAACEAALGVGEGV